MRKRLVDGQRRWFDRSATSEPQIVPSLNIDLFGNIAFLATGSLAGSRKRSEGFSIPCRRSESSPTGLEKS